MGDPKGNIPRYKRLIMDEVWPDRQPSTPGTRRSLRSLAPAGSRAVFLVALIPFLRKLIS
jgi:hypothetical protein